MEEAARQAGIPLSEVNDYVSIRMRQLDDLNFELRLMGHASIKKALTKLSELVRKGERVGLNFESTDLEAAKALAKMGIDAIKLAKTGGLSRDRDDANNDIFDVTPNPWDLKKIE